MDRKNWSLKFLGVRGLVCRDKKRACGKFKWEGFFCRRVEGSLGEVRT